jgi:hypothetical protein
MGSEWKLYLQEFQLKSAENLNSGRCDSVSTRFQKYRIVFRGNRSLTVAAPIRAARVSKRFLDTLANF